MAGGFDRTLEVVAALGQAPDARFPLLECALTLSRLVDPTADLDEARGLVEEMAETFIAAQAAMPPALGPTMLAEVLSGRYGLVGDTETYDDPRNADLVQVLIRRRGLPVALGVITIAVARIAGWVAGGVDLPGHFVLRAVPKGCEAVLIDAFAANTVVDPEELGARIGTPLTALTNARDVPMMRDRDVLVRLQNNIKVRALKAGDLHAAGRCVAAMSVLAPDRADLWFERGLFALREQRRDDAIEAFAACLDRNPPDTLRKEAERLYAGLRKGLH